MEGRRSQRSTLGTAIVDDGHFICFRMLFAGIKETLSKLVQSPFGVVRAEEEELVDPAKVLRVSLVILNYDSDINVLCIFRLSANNKKKRKNDLPSCKSATLG